MTHLPAYIRSLLTADARPGNAPSYDSHATRPEAKSKRKAPCGKCKRLFYVKRLNAFGMCGECVLEPGRKE